MTYVVDTCIINKLADGTIGLSDLPTDGNFVVSHVQHDELMATRNETRRNVLLATFDTIIDEQVPTESTIIGISRIGQSRIGDGVLWKDLESALSKLNGGKKNNAQDALIAEVAIKNGYTLITADYHLQQVARERGCPVRYMQT